MKKLFILSAILFALTVHGCEIIIMDNVPKQTTETTETIETIEIIEISEEDAKKFLEENYNRFNIDGSTSMIPLHQSLDGLFASPETIESGVMHSKTVEAFEKLIVGQNDVLLGVDYSDELLEKAKNSGVDLAKKEITREAFVFLINKNNPVQSLGIDQLKDIYSGKIKNWSEVGGDDAPINAYQRNSDSGSQIRMIKFMGDVKLSDQDVTYWSFMGEVVEQIGNYDEGKYSIAYNMYTFTEKQYPNDDVILLDVDGVHPSDETIFDESYPIVIYNYIYYDKNNAEAAEFAENLYAYLMGGEGQHLISDSGYVNLTTKSDRNKDVDLYDYETAWGEAGIGFHNEITGEYYAIDDDSGELLVFKTFIDYVLRETKYKDSENARGFLTLIENSPYIFINYYTVWYNEESGAIGLDPWFDAALDPDDFFDYKYGDSYYSALTYYIDEDKYVLEAMSEYVFDMYLEDGYFEDYMEYAANYSPGAIVEITREELKNLYMRTADPAYYEGNDAKIIYVLPFE